MLTRSGARRCNKYIFMVTEPPCHLSKRVSLFFFFFFLLPLLSDRFSRAYFSRTDINFSQRDRRDWNYHSREEKRNGVCLSAAHSLCSGHTCIHIYVVWARENRLPGCRLRKENTTSELICLGCTRIREGGGMFSGSLALARLRWEFNWRTYTLYTYSLLFFFFSADNLPYSKWKHVYWMMMGFWWKFVWIATSFSRIFTIFLLFLPFFFFFHRCQNRSFIFIL